MAKDTAARILDAACDLIATDGIDEVRIARVANRARASTGLVHHYFATREELLEKALIHSFERAGDDRFGDDTDADSDTDPGSAVAGLALAIRECLPYPGEAEKEWVLWVELWLRAVREPDLQPVAAALYARYRTWIEALVNAGVKSGEFSPTRPVPEIADVTMALLDGAGIRAMLADPAMDVHAARDLVAGAVAGLVGIDAKDLR